MGRAEAAHEGERRHAAGPLDIKRFAVRATLVVADPRARSRQPRSKGEADIRDDPGQSLLAAFERADGYVWVKVNN